MDCTCQEVYGLESTDQSSLVWEMVANHTSKETQETTDQKNDIMTQQH